VIIQIQEEARITDSTSQIISATRTILWTVNVYRFRANRGVTIDIEVVEANFASVLINAVFAIWKTAGTV